MSTLLQHISKQISFYVFISKTFQVTKTEVLGLHAGPRRWSMVASRLGLISPNYKYCSEYNPQVLNTYFYIVTGGVYKVSQSLVIIRLLIQSLQSHDSYQVTWL